MALYYLLYLEALHGGDKAKASNAAAAGAVRPPGRCDSSSSGSSDRPAPAPQQAAHTPHPAASAVDVLASAVGALSLRPPSAAAARSDGSSSGGGSSSSACFPGAASTSSSQDGGGSGRSGGGSSSGYSSCGGAAGSGPGSAEAQEPEEGWEAAAASWRAWCEYYQAQLGALQAACLQQDRQLAEQARQLAEARDNAVAKEAELQVGPRRAAPRPPGLQGAARCVRCAACMRHA